MVQGKNLFIFYTDDGRCSTCRRECETQQLLLKNYAGRLISQQTLSAEESGLWGRIRIQLNCGRLWMRILRIAWLSDAPVDWRNSQRAGPICRFAFELWSPQPKDEDDTSDQEHRKDQIGYG